MSRLRKPSEPAKKFVKTGVSLPSEVLADLDYISRCTRFSRSSILVAVSALVLHDIAESFRESVYLFEQSPNDFEVDAVAAAFLSDLAKLQGGSGTALFFPREVIEHDGN